MPIVDTATNGWQRVGVHELGWRKSLHAKHWAQVTRAGSGLGWDWVIFKADPVTMVPNVIADGMDISLAAAKDDVDHWNDNYHAHAVMLRPRPTGWHLLCRVCGGQSGLRAAHVARVVESHAECEAVWQRGEVSDERRGGRWHG